MGCGSVTGNSRLHIVRGEMYRLSGLWTHKVNGVVVPLDANDWSAMLVIRRNLTAPLAMLELTSDPVNGITLSTEDDSIRFHVEIPASVTTDLPTGKGFRYTLAFTNLSDAEDVRVPIQAGYVDIADTAL